MKTRKHIQHKKKKINQVVKFSNNLELKMYLEEKLVRSWFMDRRPGMLSKICGPEICVFVAPMFRSKKEKIPDRYSQTKSKNDPEL